SSSPLSRQATTTDSSSWHRSPRRYLPFIRRVFYLLAICTDARPGLRGAVQRPLHLFAARARTRLHLHQDAGPGTSAEQSLRRSVTWKGVFALRPSSHLLGASTSPPPLCNDG